MQVFVITNELLNNAYTYEAYRQLLDELMAVGKTTGAKQEEWIVDYARLNLARMKRLDKTFHPDTETTKIIQNIKRRTVWLTITEGWCGDAAQIVPVINELAATNNLIQHKLILRDEHHEVIDQFLTNGKSRSIPKTVFIDLETLDVTGSWGPRPTAAQQLIDELNAANTDFKIVAEKLHRWYADDQGQQTAKEFIAAFNK